MAYNTVIVFVAYAVLPAASLNNNDANLDFLKTQVDTTIANGRLTLETGVAVSTTDQTAKTTLYFAPYNGNRIGLKSGSSWDLYTFTEKSLSLASYIKGVLYDIYGYVSAGALTLESLAWKKVTASNSPTAGSSKEINISDTGDLDVGREVSIKDGTNSEITTIISLVANTSITVDLVSGYTTPDVYGFNTRATALTLDDGKWVKSGDATRRYLGTIRITSTTGQCEDSASRRNVWNFRNRLPRTLYGKDGTDTWTYTTDAWRASNASVAYGVARVGFVIGLNEEPIAVENYGIASSPGAAPEAAVGIGIDKTDTNIGQVSGAQLTNSNALKISLHALYQGFAGIGAHYLQSLERSTATSTTTWYGDNGGPTLRSGILAVVLM